MEIAGSLAVYCGNHSSRDGRFTLKRSELSIEMSKGEDAPTMPPGAPGEQL